MRNINHPAAEAAFAAVRAAQAARFPSTSCSQCGTDTGPGNSGFSRCADHAVLRTAAQAIDASRRPAFEDQHAEAYRAPRARPSFTVHDLRDQIAEAQRLLNIADGALCEWFGQVDMDRARRLMDDAADALAEG